MELLVPESEWRDRSRLAFDGVDVLLVLAWWTGWELALAALGIDIKGVYDARSALHYGLITAGMALPFVRRRLFGGPIARVRREASVLGVVGLLLVTFGFLAAVAGAWCSVRRPDPPPSQAQLDGECNDTSHAFEMYAVSGDPRVDAARKAEADDQVRQACRDASSRSYAEYAGHFRQVHVVGLELLLAGTLVVALGCLLDRLRMRRDQRAMPA